MIRSMLRAHFDVEVDAAADAAEAIRAMRRSDYVLVLANRLFHGGGGEGLQLIRQTRRDGQLSSVPIMLVSDFEDAQTAAVQAGAVRGFGKSVLGTADTVDRLAEHLPPRTGGR
jgi:CheY-like chemotaxis protein